MKPTGKSKKAYEAGKRAFLAGDHFESNPNKYGPDVSMSLWWEAGWNSEWKKTLELIGMDSIDE